MISERGSRKVSRERRSSRATISQTARAECYACLSLIDLFFALDAIRRGMSQASDEAREFDGLRRELAWLKKRRK